MTAPGDGRRVLLVDDAAEVRMLLEVCLSTAGFVVTAEADGPAAVAAATDAPPDAVLLDVQLPGLDGPQVLQALRAQASTADVPVVFLTAAPDQDLEALQALGARGVLRKPFSIATVADDLAALLP